MHLTRACLALIFLRWTTNHVLSAWVPAVTPFVQFLRGNGVGGRRSSGCCCTTGRRWPLPTRHGRDSNTAVWRLDLVPTLLNGDTDWPHKFPAQEHCSKCGLCETPFVLNVTQACAFLPQLGMRRLDELEVAVHGRSRSVDTIVWSRDTVNSDGVDEARFGVLDAPMQLIQGMGMPDAQWTGVVTSICLAMLESGQVDAVVCVAAAAAAEETNSTRWMVPEPILARTAADLYRGRGVKPSLAPSLKVLQEIKDDPSIRRLLYCGVGCSVQAFRVIERDLNLDRVYVLGTNCADNSPTPQAAATFLQDGVGITDPLSTVQGYEFMPDYRVHVKTNQLYLTKPYFSLPGTIAEQSIAKSCLACFDYTNGLADVVIGYMGAPLLETNNGWQNPVPMNQSLQTVSIRNALGSIMIQTAVSAARIRLLPTTPPQNGIFEALVAATVEADAHILAMVGGTVPANGMPVWMGEILALALRSVGPKGMNFARYSIDYHVLRNYLYVLGQQQHRRQHAVGSRVETVELIQSTRNMLPLYAQRIVKFYTDTNASVRNLESKIARSQKPR
jgi:coenzyme F420-reducing hydrogenase beta subunit